MKTTQKERFEVLHRLDKLGIDYESACRLRRIAMTLHSWFERECGDANGNCIERDETTGIPYLTYEAGNGPRKRYRISDRETGAKKRLAGVMKGYPDLIPYIQGDCRGASLYILRKSDIGPGESIDSIYTRGTAVY